MNGLGVDQNHFGCFGSVVGEPTITLTFRDAQGKRIAQGVLPGDGRFGPCNPFRLAVNGKRTPKLVLGDVLHRIQQRLHADFSPPVPRDISSCLHGRGWHVRTTSDRVTLRKNGVPSTITFRPTGRVTITGPRHLAIFRCLRRSPGFGYLG
jgi:hypothetical protein